MRLAILLLTGCLASAEPGVGAVEAEGELDAVAEPAADAAPSEADAKLEIGLFGRTAEWGKGC